MELVSLLAGFKWGQEAHEEEENEKEEKEQNKGKTRHIKDDRRGRLPLRAIARYGRIFVTLVAILLILFSPQYLISHLRYLNY